MNTIKFEIEPDFKIEENKDKKSWKIIHSYDIHGFHIRIETEEIDEKVTKVDHIFVDENNNKEITLFQNGYNLTKKNQRKRYCIFGYNPYRREMAEKVADRLFKSTQWENLFE